jgi:hypothetical protein
MRKKSRWILLLAAISSYLLVALYPYDVGSPLKDNGAEWLHDGTLHFRAPGIARTQSPPEWLDDATRSHRLSVFLRVRPADLSQTGPARIFTVSRDPWNRNITLGQDADALVLRLRTQETDADGQPERVIPGVFTGARWIEFSVTIVPGRIHIEIDGRVRFDDRLPDRPLKHFDRTYRLALGNEFTADRPWLGEISRATVTAGTFRVDYVDAARVELPRRLRHFHNPPRLIPFRDVASTDGIVNLLAFVPLGLLFGCLTVERNRRSTGWAIAAIALVSLCIEALQWWMPGRFMSIDDLLLNTLGGMAGLLLAQTWSAALARKD